MESKTKKIQKTPEENILHSYNLQDNSVYHKPQDHFFSHFIISNLVSVSESKTRKPKEENSGPRHTHGYIQSDDHHIPKIQQVAREILSKTKRWDVKFHT